MINFKILKKSKTSRARLGYLETEHGVVETPCLVPVATQAVVKTLDSKEVEETDPMFNIPPSTLKYALLLIEIFASFPILITENPLLQTDFWK